MANLYLWNSIRNIFFHFLIVVLEKTWVKNDFDSPLNQNLNGNLEPTTGNEEIKIIEEGSFNGGVFGKRDTESVQKRKIQIAHISHGLIFNSRGK